MKIMSLDSIISKIKQNLSYYVYGIFITSLFAFFYLNSWLDSFEEPVGIVVDSSGNIPKKSDQAKEQRQGSRFWRHQLRQVELMINEPERLVRERQALDEMTMKNQELANSVSEIVDETVSEKYPEMKKIQALERQKKRQEFEIDRAMSAARWELMYERSLRRRDELIQLKEIVIQKLGKAEMKELSAEGWGCVTCK